MGCTVLPFPKAMFIEVNKRINLATKESGSGCVMRRARERCISHILSELAAGGQLASNSGVKNFFYMNTFIATEMMTCLHRETQEQFQKYSAGFTLVTQQC